MGQLGRELANILRGGIERKRGDKHAIAGQLGISKSQLDRLLKGERPITIDQADIISGTIGKSLSAVLAEAESDTPGRPRDRTTYPSAADIFERGF
ncbi:hypothetical protein BST24_24040 [Mycobacteroides franklinii]|nr:hypothetical protein A3O05_16565 [Mycobacteroides abscessus]ORA57274.1 hypothetical protein BST24_24040 [Mycobacteroides franklinii]